MPENPVLRCPECADGHLVEQVNRKTGGHFMGCSNYPECEHTQAVPAYIFQLRAGAAPLPGFE